MGEPFALRLSRQAERTLRQADAPTRARIGRALDRLQHDPFDDTLDVRPLRAQPAAWRLRVGDWRVIYDVDLRDRIVEVHLILPRGDAYR